MHQTVSLPPVPVFYPLSVTLLLNIAPSPVILSFVYTRTALGGAFARAAGQARQATTPAQGCSQHSPALSATLPRPCAPSPPFCCRWINNCLGMNNHKFFLQFLAFVCIGCVYAAGMHGANVAWCMSTKQCPRPSPNRLVIGVVAGVLAVFFAIFVIAMMCDQYEALVTDTTGIEAMKKWDLDKIPIDKALVTIFGEQPSINWILPTEMPDETAFNHDKWELADYDEWDQRDPLLRSHYDQVKGFDWIDDTTRFRYSVETVLGALNAGVPKGARSRYVVGKDGYPELRVFPGEEKLFPELGDDEAAVAPPKRSTTSTASKKGSKMEEEQDANSEDDADAREADFEAYGAAADAGAPEEEDIDLIGCKRPATSPDVARAGVGAEKPNEDDVKLLD